MVKSIATKSFALRDWPDPLLQRNMKISFRVNPEKFVYGHERLLALSDVVTPLTILPRNKNGR
jgi:hypothetical protein